MGDIVKFLDADLLQVFPSLLQLLVELDRLFLHPFVRGFRASHQTKILPAGQAQVPIPAVKPQTQKDPLKTPVHPLLILLQELLFLDVPFRDVPVFPWVLPQVRLLEGEGFQR